MPMQRLVLPAGQYAKTEPLEVRVQGGETLYTLNPSVPVYIEPSHVAAVATAVAAAIAGAVMATQPE